MFALDNEKCCYMILTQRVSQEEFDASLLQKSLFRTHCILVIVNVNISIRVSYRDEGMGLIPIISGSIAFTTRVGQRHLINFASEQANCSVKSKACDGLTI
jgi:hypothetical protein